MSPAKAHSMRGDFGPADWPHLQLDEVRSVLELFAIAAGGAKLVWHSPRPLSTAAIVELPNGAVFVKRHDRRIRTVPQLEEEHGFMAHLYAQGAAVCRVLRTLQGASAYAQGDWTYEVHELGAGADLYRDAVSWSPFTSYHHALAAGQALAALHAAARSYQAPARAAHVLVSNDAVIASAQPLEIVRGYMSERPALRDYLQRRQWPDQLARAIAPYHAAYLDCAAPLARMWTHNDWHASNLLWSETGPLANVQTVLDFGLSDRTSAVYDLATAIERNTIPWIDIQEGRRGEANRMLVTGLLQGYLTAATLTGAERAALVAILPIVHIGFALTEIDYFHGITRSKENADLAYEAFLLGHCRWFSEPDGAALLWHMHERLEAIP
jgi:Ser/Thr protein kinase RdoA (MazF antagonist)